MTSLMEALSSTPVLYDRVITPRRSGIQLRLIVNEYGISDQSTAAEPYIKAGLLKLMRLMYPGLHNVKVSRPSSQMDLANGFSELDWAVAGSYKPEDFPAVIKYQEMLQALNTVLVAAADTHENRQIVDIPTFSLLLHRKDILAQEHAYQPALCWQTEMHSQFYPKQVHVVTACQEYQARLQSVLQYKGHMEFICDAKDFSMVDWFFWPELNEIPQLIQHAIVVASTSSQVDWRPAEVIAEDFYAK